MNQERGCGRGQGVARGSGGVGSLSEGGAGDSGQEAALGLFESLPYSIHDTVPSHSFNMFWDEKEHYKNKSVDLMQCIANMEKRW